MNALSGSGTTKGATGLAGRALRMLPSRPKSMFMPDFLPAGPPRRREGLQRFRLGSNSGETGGPINAVGSRTTGWPRSSAVRVSAVRLGNVATARVQG